MLAAIIRSHSSSDGLAATLSALIPAVAAGFLGHAVIVGTKPDTAIEKLADATGAALVIAPLAESWQAGARAARGDWLLLLDAGDLPDFDWTRNVERHLLVASQRPALMPVSGFIPALAERTMRLLRPRVLAAGLVTMRREAEAGVLSAGPLRLRVTRQTMQG